MPRGDRLINVTVAPPSLAGPHSSFGVAGPPSLAGPPSSFGVAGPPSLAGPPSSFGVAGLLRGASAARGAASMQDATFDLETTRLAARAQGGDADAFSALVELHHRSARRVALAALGNLADADEAVQEACLTAWRRIDRLDDPAAFRAWLLRITWRKALDRRRSVASWIKRIRRDSSDEQSRGGSRTAPTESFEDIAANGETPDVALLARERDRVVAQLIRSLPPRLRDPFLLAASGEHRYEDIAVLLRIPLGTVKWRMVEARRVLREKLTRMGFGEPV